LQQCQSGDFSWGRAGLYNLFATFLTVGEPAPTGLLRMVQDLSYAKSYFNTPLLFRPRRRAKVFVILPRTRITSEADESLR
jgi:hypothetical protein